MLSASKTWMMAAAAVAGTDRRLVAHHLAAAPWNLAQGGRRILGTVSIHPDAAQQPHFDSPHPFSADAELPAYCGVGETRASQLRHLALTFGQGKRRGLNRGVHTRRRLSCFLNLIPVNIQSVIVDCEYAREMLAEIIIAAVIALDAILFVRAYRANVAYKSRARQRRRRFIAE